MALRTVGLVVQAEAVALVGRDATHQPGLAPVLQAPLLAVPVAADGQVPVLSMVPAAGAAGTPRKTT